MSRSIALLIVFLCGCSAPRLEVAPPSTPTPGAIENAIPIDHFGATTNRVMLWWAGIRGASFDRSIDCYRVTYWSVDARGKPILVSALVALPDGEPRGVVAWQHGTTTRREEVPSRLAFEGTMTARLFAGMGYALVATDYQGLGDSPDIHPYLVAETAANDVVYALQATSSIVTTPLPVILVGFSQGAHATLAALHALESVPSATSLAAIAIAGPHNLRHISFPTAMTGQSPNDSLYLAYMVRGFAHAYGRSADSVLRSDQVANVDHLLDGYQDGDAIIAGLPKNPRDLFRDDFLAAFDANEPNWLLDALTANEVSHWRPRSPVLLLYGDNDLDVPPVEATSTAREMSAAGADVVAKSVGAFDHDQSVLEAIPTILAWLQGRSLESD